MTKENLIKTLLEQLAGQNEIERTEKTFLEIIDKHSNEEYVSKILAYILENNPALCAALIKLKHGEDKLDSQTLTVDKVSCEKNMIEGRADIFVEASLGDRTNYTLTIENKIYSLENAKQTERYHNFVDTNYSKRTNTFIYLKPDFNASEPHDKEFLVLGYKELLNLLELYADDNDGVTKDFKSHIKKYFIKNSEHIMDAERTAILHYNELKDLLKNAKNKYDEYRNKLGDEILKEKLIFDDEIPDYRTAEEKGKFVADVSSPVFFRIFKQGVWRNDGEDVPDSDKYFFYIETALYDNIREISTRIVVRSYGSKPSDSKVYQFMSKEGAASLNEYWFDKYGEKPAKSEWDNSHYFVYDPRGDFKSGNEILSEEWTNDLKKHIQESMREYAKRADRLFEEFKSYLESQ